jgi:hypothetical protein
MVELVGRTECVGDVEDVVRFGAGKRGGAGAATSPVWKRRRAWSACGTSMWRTECRRRPRWSPGRTPTLTRRAHVVGRVDVIQPVGWPHAEGSAGGDVRSTGCRGSTRRRTRRAARTVGPTARVVRRVAADLAATTEQRRHDRGLPGCGAERESGTPLGSAQDETVMHELFVTAGRPPSSSALMTKPRRSTQKCLLALISVTPGVGGSNDVRRGGWEEAIDTIVGPGTVCVRWDDLYWGYTCRLGLGSSS